MPQKQKPKKSARPVAAKTKAKPKAVAKKPTKRPAKRPVKAPVASKRRLSKSRLLLFAVAFAAIGVAFMLYAQAAADTQNYYLGFGNGTNASLAFTYGNVGDKPVACKLAGKKGASTVSVYRPSEGKFYLHGSNDSTPGATVVALGTSESQPLCGDWDGNGTYTVGIYTASGSTHKFELQNSNKSLPADKTIDFGQAGDIALACDWNSDGKTDIGIYRPNNQTFYFQWMTTSPTGSGKVDRSFQFGNPGDLPVCGDWNGANAAGIGVYRPGNQTFYLSDDTNPTKVNYQFAYGNPGDKPLAGDWQAQGFDLAGVYRVGPTPTKPTNSTSTSLGFQAKNVLDPSSPAAAFSCVVAGKTISNVTTKEACDYFAKAYSAGYFSAGAPAPAPAAAKVGGVTMGTETLQLGSRGDGVKALQTNLNILGYALTVDGDFGPATKNAVMAFQGSYNIPVDGVVGALTKAALFTALSGAPAPSTPIPNPVAPPPVEVTRNSGTPSTGSAWNCWVYGSLIQGIHDQAACNYFKNALDAGYFTAVTPPAPAPTPVAAPHNPQQTGDLSSLRTCFSWYLHTNGVWESRTANSTTESACYDRRNLTIPDGFASIVNIPVNHIDWGGKRDIYVNPSNR